MPFILLSPWSLVVQSLYLLGFSLELKLWASEVLTLVKEKPGQLPTEHHHMHTQVFPHSLNQHMHVYVRACDYRGGAWLLLFLSPGLSKYVRQTHRNTHSVIRRGRMTARERDESGWQRQNDSQRDKHSERKWDDRLSGVCACVCVCVHSDKKKQRYLFYSSPLTRVFIEWQCVSIDQVLLPCEHFYSPKVQ